MQCVSVVSFGQGSPIQRPRGDPSLLRMITELRTCCLPNLGKDTQTPPIDSNWSIKFLGFIRSVILGNF